MNSKEKLKEVINLVDMSKIDLPSYNISVKKYDEIAKAYTKIMFFVSVLELNNKNNEDADAEKKRNEAINVISKLIESPNYYFYEDSHKRVSEFVDNLEELKMFRSYFDENKVRSLRNKTIKTQMVKRLKDMLSILKIVYETYEEKIIEHSLDDEIFERKLKDLTQMMNKKIEECEKDENTDKDVEQDVKDNEMVETGEGETKIPETPVENAEPKRKKIWRKFIKLFGFSGDNL